MTSEISFTYQVPISYESLSLTIISLEDWGMVNITGADAEKYLQGQLTADVAALSPNQHVLSAHCDAKGKMWSDLRLFRRNSTFSYLVRKNLIQLQVAELKKYAVFSKVTIAADQEFVLLGLAGEGARQALASHYALIPNAENQVIETNNVTLLHISYPNERFIIISPPPQAEALIQSLNETTRANSAQWLSLEIEAGFAIIDSPTSATFIPQATNLQALPGGICFKKGCYTGQEMVARAKFRGANKRALFWLKGSGTTVPEAGDDIEWQLGDKWRRTGTILSAIRLNDGNINIQVVMNNDMPNDSVFRIKNDEQSHLTLQTLPYSLEEK